MNLEWRPRNNKLFLADRDRKFTGNLACIEFADDNKWAVLVWNDDHMAYDNMGNYDGFAIAKAVAIAHVRLDAPCPS